MKLATTFDESLGKFVGLVAEKIGDSGLSKCLFLRDPVGTLTCVMPPSLLDAQNRKALAEEAEVSLDPYVEKDGFAVATAAELFDESLDCESVGIRVRAPYNGVQFTVRLLDRRVMGGAWLQRSENVSTSKRLIFASLKGGVGRSTALCVLAAELASQGYRVLAVDMDVEAPGIGSMLLDEGTMPRFGLLDYLVESGLQELGDEFYESLTGPSWLAAGQGVVSVIPAIGKESIAHPQNILSKIARAYLSGGGSAALGVTEKMKMLLDRIDQRNEFDVVLIDARAGLHETTGSALLGLGGRVVLFGTDQKQTLDGFDILFANLAMVDCEGWRDRLVVVHAKAFANVELQKAFASKVQESFVNIFIPVDESPQPVEQSLQLKALDGVFEIEWEESDDMVRERTDSLISERYRSIDVASILESEGYRDFDPLNRPDTLMGRLYWSVYGDFLEKVKALIELPEAAENVLF
ncbi:KGGVGR-motif variant AAA ATPase [Aquabacterium sp.]|uniref:KGGVGR-motif variant AAA ATPase n=1 Tax=Aquabacterium sp. TaxID=1872578 RepID=UPI003D03DCF7